MKNFKNGALAKCLWLVFPSGSKQTDLASSTASFINPAHPNPNLLAAADHGCVHRLIGLVQSKKTHSVQKEQPGSRNIFLSIIFVGRRPSSLTKLLTLYTSDMFDLAAKGIRMDSPELLSLLLGLVLQGSLAIPEQSIKKDKHTHANNNTKMLYESRVCLHDKLWKYCH